jgi:predicted metal-dependent peptidase
MPRIEDMKLTSPVAGHTGAWPKLKLSAKHQKSWDETRTAMLWTVPSFSDIWLSMMVDRDGTTAWFTDAIPTAATDDKILYINPDWFFALTLDERIFVACHEICHSMFGHCGMFFMLDKQGEIRYPDGVTLGVSAELLNLAADYVLNAQLVEAKIGRMPEGGLHWPQLIKPEIGVLEAYRILWERLRQQQPQRPQRPNKPGKQQQQGQDPGQAQLPDDLKRTTQDKFTQDAGTGRSFDQHLKPGQGRGKTSNEAMSERNEQSWANAVAAAMASGELRGDMPASLLRTFKGRLTPKVNWQDIYFATLTRRVGNDRYSWEQLDQQLIYRGIGAPGRISYGCNLLIVAADSSGSISQHTLDVFLSESRAILEVIRPRRIIFAQCDARVHEWTEIDDIDELRGEVRGGGGTDFRPVFERIEQENEDPDVLVFLTDGYGSFPATAPHYPIIWGSIALKPEGYPFGEVVMVPPQHA